MNKSFFIAFLLFLSYHVNAQLGDARLPSFFGIQVRSVFPSEFVGNPVTSLSKDALAASITQSPGYSFGGIVRVGLSELIALETGINFTQRYFKLRGSIADSGIYVTNSLGFIQYDVPVNALFYIKLSKKWYANASLGLTAGFKPTSIATLNNINGSQFFYHTGVVDKKTSFDLNGNLGFEFRTKKSGFFYLGTTVRIPTKPLFIYVATYKNQGFKVTQYGDVSGSFLGIDLRYFFRNVRAIAEDKKPIE
jgi:Outer membrane protein beta-barrel domain